MGERTSSPWAVRCGLCPRVSWLARTASATPSCVPGYHPDVSLLRGAGVHVDEDTLKPDLDLDTLETNVPGLFVAGAIASGRETSRIFIENGRFHGEAIVAAISARADAAPARR